MESINLTLEIAAKTSVGMVREANEDNFIVTTDSTSKNWIIPQQPYVNSTYGSVFVVADGMGGTNAGEVASKIAVDSVRDYIASVPADKISVSNLRQILVNSIIVANNNIVAHGKKYPDTDGMGTTIVIAWVFQQKVHVAWVGDSRCYLLRRGRLTQISKDHSYVQTLVDKGSITKEEAFLHPESNIITQSLGDDSRKPKPDYVTHPLVNDDVLLLCSDGLNSMLRDANIESIIAASDTGLSATADALIQAANDEGGHDNITVLLAKVGGKDVAKNEIVAVEQIRNEGTNNLQNNSFPEKPPTQKHGNPYKLISLLLAMLLLGGAGYLYRNQILNLFGKKANLIDQSTLVDIQKSITEDSSKCKSLIDTLTKWENDVKNNCDSNRSKTILKEIDSKLNTPSIFDTIKLVNNKNLIDSLFRLLKIEDKDNLKELKERIDNVISSYSSCKERHKNLRSKIKNRNSPTTTNSSSISQRSKEKNNKLIGSELTKSDTTDNHN